MGGVQTRTVVRSRFTHFCCKLLDKELQLEPVHVCELLVIFCSDAELLLEKEERESVLHVSATGKEDASAVGELTGKIKCKKGFGKFCLCHLPDVH